MLKLKKTSNNKDHNNQQSPYGIDKLAQISPGVKIGFLKFWLGGAIFLVSFMTFFSSYDFSNEFIISFLLLTLGTEYVSNKVIIWMNHEKTPTYIYLPFGYIDRKKLMSLLSSMLYSFITIIGVTLIYLLIRIVLGQIGLLLIGKEIYTGMIFSFNGTDNPDPVTIGLIYLLFDKIWVTIRRLIEKRKNSNNKEED